MTKTAWAHFSYPVTLRRKGHRKVEKVITSALAAFGVPAVSFDEAPAALRFRTEGAEGKLLRAVPTQGEIVGTDMIRSFDGKLFAPLYGEDGQTMPAEKLTDAALGKTDLSEGKFIAGCRLILSKPAAELPLNVEIKENGHEETYRRLRAEVARRFVEIGGILHVECDEPMLAVKARRSDARSERRVVEIGLLRYFGQKFDKAEVICFLKLSDWKSAFSIGDEVAVMLGAVDLPSTSLMQADGRPRASLRDRREPEIVDLSALNADPVRITLIEVLDRTVQAVHEALLKAPDEFVLAWADMRECLESLKAGHDQAASFGIDALRRLVVHRPGKDEFPNDAVRKRWESETLPLISARLRAIDMMGHPAPEAAAACEP